MNKPKVSIIIPAFNVEKYIEKGLKSCLNQSYDDIEIVVIDDGSEDNTGKIINNYSSIDDRIIYKKQTNQGVSSARNKALSISTGEYCIFLDSDDWLEDNTVEMLLSFMPKDNNSAFILCGRYIVNETDNSKQNYDKRKCSEIVKGKDILLRYRNPEFCFQSSCYKLFDLQLIKKNHIKFDETISHGEDGLFVFTYLQYVDTIVSNPIPLWNILDRHNSATNTPFSKNKLTAIKAIEKMMEFDLSDDVKAELSKYLIDRTETMIGDAALSNSKGNIEDIIFLRNVLINNKRTIIDGNYNGKLLLRFYLCLYCPIKILGLIFKIRQFWFKKGKPSG